MQRGLSIEQAATFLALAQFSLSMGDRRHLFIGLTVALLEVKSV
jgi:hypothetical protein